MCAGKFPLKAPALATDKDIINYLYYMYYIAKFYQQESNRLHSIVTKKVVGETTYVSAIGYGGGGVFEEFCGKFYWDEAEEGLVGLFSSFHDPDEWENRSFEYDIIDEPFELISENDKKIINQMTEEIWDKYLKYDEESGVRYIRHDFLEKMEGDYLFSKDWDIDVVDLISNNFWGLSLTFDW